MSTPPPMTFLNPMLRALFQAPDPGPLLRKIRISLRDSSRFLLIVPPAKLMWAYEADTKQPFADAFLTDEFIASHVVFIPSDYRSSDKSKLMSTYNAKKIILARGFVQTHSGFKSSYHSDIVAEYIIRPGAPFLADDAEFLCCEVTYPLMGTPVFYDLLDQSTDSTKQILFDGNILDTPVPLGLDVATLKDNVNKLRDFKLLPVIYGQELSRLDYEFTLLVNQFNCDHVSTKEHLLRLYNDTIDTAIAKFQALGSNTINRIASETMLSGLDLANMIGMHIESQLHSLLWEKTLELCQEEDTRRLDNCWKVKDISIEQVGIPLTSISTLFDLDELVLEAVKLFSAIGSVSGVRAKTKVLLTVMQILSGGTPEADPSAGEALQRVSKCSVHFNAELQNDPTYSVLKSNISADVLLSLMLLVVIRSDILCVASVFWYIQNFSFDDVNLGQLGYALSTLEAVLYHLDEKNTNMVSLSEANGRLWSKVKAGADLKEYISGLSNDGSDLGTLLRSKSPQGSTLPMHYLQTKNYDTLEYLLGLDAYNNNFIIADRDSVGSTLLITALETENKNLIDLVYSCIKDLDPSLKRRYIIRLNNWKRSAGHYIFNAHWLLPSIGEYINWEQRDHANQTPLFIVCRCYDHSEYQELVSNAFKSWEHNFRSMHKRRPLSLAYHIDPKDNSLLHVLKDVSGLKQLLKYDVDINWPNEQGYTPLMFHSKFSRAETVQVLLEDKRIDVHFQSEMGVGSIEVARDAETIKLLERVYLPDEKLAKNDQAIGIVRASFSKGNLSFVICTGNPSDPGSITSVKRTIDDFRFLEEWLSYENRYSWVPSLAPMFNPKFFRGKIVYQVFHDIQIKLNTFLKVLTLHPTFATHELLWEFLLVQDIRRDSIIERCRRKLENARESQMEQQSQQLIFTSADSMAVEVFFDHAQQEIGQLSRASHNLHRAVVRLACKVDDYNTSFRILSDMVAKLKLIRGNAIPRYGRIEQKLAVLAAVQPPDAYHEFASSLYSVCAMVDDVMKTIRSPLAAILQLRDRETILISSRETLERVTSKSGPSWTNVFFEEKKRKETEELRDRIYIVQTEIDRISTDIRGQHVTLASEIGAVYGTHEQLMAQMVKVFTSKIIRSQRVSLERLERMKAGLQSVGRRRRVPAEKYSLA